MTARILGVGRQRRQTQIADLGEQAVQGRLLGDHGHAAGLAAELRPVEPGRPAVVEDALDADPVPHARSRLLGDDGHQQVAGMCSAGVDGDLAAEHLRWAVLRHVVQAVVVAGDAERQPVAGGTAMEVGSTSISSW